MKSVPLPTAFTRAQNLVATLAAGGVRHWIYCPGSRSAPLGYALAQAEEKGLVTVSVRLDERAGAFEALGLTLAGQRAAVTCTSGSAVANLHPAVLEASHSRLPLVVVSADRPAWLRYSGASQTTDQSDIFASAIRGLWDLQPLPGCTLAAESAAARAALAWGAGQWPPAGWENTEEAGAQTGPDAAGDTDLAPWPGPVQINLGLVEPLIAQSGEHSPAFPPGLEGKDKTAAITSRLEKAPIVQTPLLGQDLAASGAKSVVLAGEGAPHSEELWRAISAAALPVLAEPSSGWRTHPQAIAAYREVLKTPLASEITRVITLGRPTLSRPVAALLARRDIQLEILQKPGPTFDVAGTVRRRWEGPAQLAAALAGPASQSVAGLTGQSAQSGEWLEEWRQAGEEAARAYLPQTGGTPQSPQAPGGADSAAARAPEPLTEEVAAALLWRQEGNLLLGASLPVRACDLVAQSEPYRRDKADGQVFSNRGLAGIDGNIATALGIARAAGGPQAPASLHPYTRALIGDLTFLHDLGALNLGRREKRPDLQIVVLENGGGQIFAGLEHGRSAEPAVFERFFLTPQSGDTVQVAQALGVAARRVETAGQLQAALEEAPAGISVVAVRIVAGGRP